MKPQCHWKAMREALRLRGLLFAAILAGAGPLAASTIMGPDGPVSVSDATYALSAQAGVTIGGPNEYPLKISSVPGTITSSISPAGELDIVANDGSGDGINTTSPGCSVSMINNDCGVTPITATLNVLPSFGGASDPAGNYVHLYGIVAGESVMVDPVFSIDPAFLASNPGYTLAFSDGVGNTPASTPEPKPGRWLSVGSLSWGWGSIGGDQTGIIPFCEAWFEFDELSLEAVSAWVQAFRTRSTVCGQNCSALNENPLLEGRPP